MSFSDKIPAFYNIFRSGFLYSSLAAYRAARTGKPFFSGTPVGQPLGLADQTRFSSDFVYY